MLEELKERVYRANVDLVKSGLTLLSWGSVSGIDREQGLIVVSPCGVARDEMTAEDMVVVDLVDGRVAEGKRKPAADTPAHLHLYRTFPQIGGVVFSLSANATAWAQAGKGLPAYGTAHAAAFCGEVPCTRELTEDEAGRGELNVGKVIEETFRDKDPVLIPAALVKGHGAYTWGESPERAAENAVALEFSAKTALKTLRIEPEAKSVQGYVFDKCRVRGKRGRGAGKR